MLVVLTGCDGSTAIPTPSSLSLDASENVDLRFGPLDWTHGERMVVDVGSAQLQSTAGPDGHRIELASPGRDVLLVEGLVDGQVIAAAAPHLGSDVTSGGLAANGPTSIHYATVCRGGTCTEIVEYDYDMTDPDGNGTTSWQSPSGETSTVDRVRFVLAGTAAPAHLDITSPRPLDVVR